MYRQEKGGVTRLRWELNHLWPYKDMLCVLQWSRARPTARVKCWQVQCQRAQNRASKRFNYVTKMIHFADLGILVIFGLWLFTIWHFFWYLLDVVKSCKIFLCLGGISLQPGNQTGKYSLIKRISSHETILAWHFPSGYLKRKCQKIDPLVFFCPRCKQASFIETFIKPINHHISVPWTTTYPSYEPPHICPKNHHISVP